MSTRCNIIVKDAHQKLYFYRHSDGYPEGAMPTLEKFMQYVKDGLIRNNVGQAAGWLIVLGAAEYDYKYVFNEGGSSAYVQKTTPLNAYEPTNEGYSGWKVGAIEPTDCIHGDIEFLYILDLDTKTITTITEDFEKYGV